MAQEIGSAKAIHGHVTALGPEGARTLSVGSPVFKGDTLSTAKGAAGSIQFLDKTVLNVGEASKVSLDQYVYDASKGSGQVLFKMAQGTFRAVTGEIVKQNPESFKMQSPLATIGIRGTETAHTVPGPGQNEASESHLVMVFDGKPVIVQPLGGGAFQVLSQAGVKVEVGKFGAGPVMVMTPQEYKYYQALTVTGLQQGVPQDTVTPQGGQQGKDPKVQAAQDAANKAAADAQAKAAAAAEAKAAAEAAAKAAAEAAASGDPAAKAAADAAAKAAAEAAAKAMADAKAAADLAAKALSEAFAAQQALALAAAAKAAADAAAKAAADAANQTTPLTLNPGSIISFSTSTDSSGHTVTTITVTPPAGGEGQSGSGTTPVIVSEVAQDIINPIDHNNDTPPGGDDTPNTPPVAGTLDLSGGSASAMVNLMAQPGFYESNGELTYLADNTANVIGSNHDDTIFGSGSANDLQGGAGNDLVYGMGGNDTIAGGEGSDTLEGGTGNDAISGGNGADILSAGSGMDSMGGGLDNMDGGNGGDMISMGRSLNNTNGLDTIQGGNGADVLLFTDNGAGANDLDTTRGVEAVVLGDATTNITFPANFTAADWADIGRVLDIDGSAIGGDTSATFTFDGSAATEDGAFAILGGHHDDTLTGGAGADSIDGGDGDDLIKGGAGDDSLSGGDGDDTIAGGDGDDDINGGGGDNIVSYALSASGVAVDLAEHYSDDGLGGHDQFTDIQNVIGSAHADSITGDESGNAIAGGAGDDNLSGGAGDDTIEGGAGADTLSGGDGDDTFVFNAGDVVYGESIDGGMGGTTIKTLGDVNFAQAGEGNLLTLDQQNGVIHTVELAQDSTATFDWDTFEGMSPQSVVIIGEEDGAERIELLSFDNGNTFRPDVFVNAEGMNGDGDRLHFVGGNQTDPDILDYSGYNEDNRFSINMASGIVSRDGGGFTHSFEQIDKVIGGAGDDTFIGALSDVTLDGGLNYNDGNTISYEGVGSGVVINISGNVLLDAAGETLAEAGTATNGTGTDTLLKFQNVTGGDGNDTISGSDETNVINAGDGDDHIYGSFGDDAYDGGAGTNTLDYSQFISDFPLTIDMSAGTASSGIDFTHNFSNIQHVIGGAGDDDITGSGTGDTIEGGAGADNLVGSGADVLSYEHDPDGVTVNLSDSTVGQWDLGAHLARDGHEALDQVTGFHIVMGSSHNDNLMGSEDADTLYGGHGDDTFFGSTGADVIHGGDGTDSLTFADFNEDHQLTLDFAAHTVTDAFGSGFTQTYDGIEMLGGGNGADTYNGSTGDDRFLASYGDDVINGNGGADTLDYSREGGASAISFGREMGPYWIWDTSGSGKDFVSGIEKIILNDADYTSSFSSSQHLTDGMLGDIAGGSTFTLDGSQLSGGHALYADGSNVSSAYDLSFLGGAGNDILSGGAGSDTLSGGSGNDSLTGGAGNDSLKMDAHLTGEDEIDGGLGVDTLSFTQQDQGGQQVGDLGGVTGVEIVKLGDADTQLWISGDSGCSNLGDDLDASHGFLTIDGSGLTGSHALTFDVSDIGSDITYQIFGGEGADSLCGGDNADTLFGGLGDDTLLGGGGADTLEGGGGADVLFGQGGADSLTGNAGNDTFWFAGTGSTAAVADFASGADTLCFYTGGGDFSAMSSPWAFSTISSGTNHSGATAQATLTYDTQDHTLYFDADGTGASAATAVATFANGAAVAQTDIVTTPVDITVH